MIGWDAAILIIVLCSALSIIATWKGILTKTGSLTAFFVGVIIGIMGHFTWVILLLVFFLTSFLATKYKFEYKRSMGVQEGKRGERRTSNVLANGAVPIFIAILSFENEFYPYLDKGMASIIFISAIAVAASDTLASELGILSKKVYMITNGRRVKPGVDGGVSLHGQIYALIAAGYTALLGYLIFSYFDLIDYGWWVILMVTGIGFLGCQVDSVFGATLERAGIMTKLSNNLTSIGIGAIIAWWILTWLI